MTQPPAIPRHPAQPGDNARTAKARRQRWLVLATLLAVMLAWVYGWLTAGFDVAPEALAVIPGASRVEARGSIYLGYDKAGQLVGYAGHGEAPGYGGPITLVVGLDPAGAVTGVRIVRQRETPSFFRLLEREGYLDQFEGQPFDAGFQLGRDLDAVSGATFSSEGVAAATRQAVRAVAAEGLGRELPPDPTPIRFGIPEVVLILLYVVGYIGHKLRSAIWRTRIRWATLITGLVVIGFIYTLPFTITQVVSLLSGYWPDWHTNLYWYLLLGGIAFVTTVDAKNPYCSWFCPFGAFQECLAALSGARHYRPRRWNAALTWVQRGLAGSAIVLGLAVRRPGVAGYEPFGTLFDLRGTPIQWIFLGLVVAASLVIYRPFCNYLCPLDPVVDFVAEVRRQVRELWQKWQTRSAKT